MMTTRRTHKPSSWNPPGQERSAPLATRPFAPRGQQASSTPPTREDIENDAFDQNKFEASGLQLKEKSGTITSVEQQRLGVLQAAMDEFWAERLSRATRLDHSLAVTLGHSPNQETSAPMPNALQRSTTGVPSWQPYGRRAVQRKIKYSGGEESKLLDVMIKNWSHRMDLYKMADEDPGIDLEIKLDEEEKVEKDLNVVGLTRGGVTIKDGAKSFYYLDPAATEPEKSLSEAIKAGDHLKISKLHIKVKVNANPLLQVVRGEQETETKNVKIPMEHRMTVFAHEWELHVAPMLEYYKWIRTQQEIIEKQGEPSKQLTSEQLEPLEKLLQGGEAAEHLDDTNIAYFFAVLNDAKININDKNAVKKVLTGELMEQNNLKISDEKKISLLGAIGVKALDRSRLNVVGEDHGKSGKRRDDEKDLNEKCGLPRDDYYLENEFSYNPEQGPVVQGDPDHKRDAFCAATIADTVDYIAELISKFDRGQEQEPKYTNTWIDKIYEQFETVDECAGILRASSAQGDNEKTIAAFVKYTKKVKREIDDLMKSILDPIRGVDIDTAVAQIKSGRIAKLISKSNSVIKIAVKKDEPSDYRKIMSGLKQQDVHTKKLILSNARSIGMHEAAQNSPKGGVWKVGWVHAKEIELHCKKKSIERRYNLIQKEDYDKFFE